MISKPQETASSALSFPLFNSTRVIALQTQVNSIEQQLRETRTEVRLGNLEEKVFGVARR